MSDIKISDRLLKFTISKDCEIHRVIGNEVHFSGLDRASNELSEHISFAGCGLKINLDTFIRLAKIKAFECGIMVVEGGSYVTTYKSDEDGYRRNRIRSFNGNPYDIKTLINCLEYVAEKGWR